MKCLFRNENLVCCVVCGRWMGVCACVTGYRRNDERKLRWEIGRYEKIAASACAWRHSTTHITKMPIYHFENVWSVYESSVATQIECFFLSFENLNLTLAEILRSPLPLIAGAVFSSFRLVTDWNEAISFVRNAISKYLFSVQFAVTWMIAHMRSAAQSTALCLKCKHSTDLRQHRFRFDFGRVMRPICLPVGMECNIDSYRPTLPIHINWL